MSRFLKVGIALSSLAALSGAAWLIVQAIRMVASGRGLETYRTFWLVEFNYIGLLVFVGAVVLALFVAAILRFRERSQWNELDRKYGEKK